MAIVNCWDRFYTLGRAPRTKETLPNFHEWCRVTRHPRIFCGLTGCQRAPGFSGVTNYVGDVIDGNVTSKAGDVGDNGGMTSGWEVSGGGVEYTRGMKVWEGGVENSCGMEVLGGGVEYSGGMEVSSVE